MKALKIIAIILVVYIIIGLIVANKVRKDSICTYGTNADGTGTAGPCPNIKMRDVFMWPALIFKGSEPMAGPIN